MMTNKLPLLSLFLLLWGCQSSDHSPQTADKAIFATHQDLNHKVDSEEAKAGLLHLFPDIPDADFDSIFNHYPSYISDGFDFSVGKPNAEGYYKALYFGQKRHLGEDWNGEGGGNTDLGDPVYTSGNGLVIFSRHVCCGWGNVVRIVHRLRNHPEYKYIETVYAHLDKRQVEVGDMVYRGKQIGTIGTADGKYSAHLHLEARNFTNMSLGPGYSDDHFGYMDPTEFIKAHRPK
ncbi:MAG: M23 family metallopeptidase [Bacteroidota bacterium]